MSQAMRWCSGSACIVVDCLIPWRKFIFPSCVMYELIQHMNSYIQWIQYEFIYFLHFKYMNSYKYEFILFTNSYIFCSYHVRIHIFFAVQNKSCEHAWAASARRERAAQAASVQREPRGRSPSSPPALTRPRPAASTVRVACGSPDS
jgi:hypothetical protein